jgi:DNA-binding transcriptional ArsR family regulator
VVKKSDPEILEVYTVSDLEQVKVMADPLRLRLLEHFCKKEMTTKQVAGELGEKPTRLYHHVDALERVGLIRLTRTQQNRGTVEKYYQAVAKMFKAEPGLFSAGDGADPSNKDAIEDLTTQLLDRTAEELRDVLRYAQTCELATEDEPLVTFAEVHAPPDGVNEIQDKLMAFLEEQSAEHQNIDGPQEGWRRFRLTIMLFPLDLEEREKKKKKKT